MLRIDGQVIDNDKFSDGTLRRWQGLSSLNWQSTGLTPCQVRLATVISVLARYRSCCLFDLDTELAHLSQCARTRRCCRRNCGNHRGCSFPVWLTGSQIRKRNIFAPLRSDQRRRHRVNSEDVHCTAPVHEDLNLAHPNHRSPPPSGRTYKARASVTARPPAFFLPLTSADAFKTRLSQLIALHRRSRAVQVPSNPRLLFVAVGHAQWSIGFPLILLFQHESCPPILWIVCTLARL
jgi:hypothetical protein